MKFLGLTFLIATAIAAGVTFTGSAAAQNPVPLINQPLVPDAKTPGGAGFTLTVNGTGFVSGSVVHWNGSPRATAFVSESRLTANIQASDIAHASTASVTVVSPGPGGGASNVVFFEITGASSLLSFEELDFSTNDIAQQNSVTTADFNGDGKLDLAVSNYATNNISILLGNGDGTFKTHVDYATELGPDSVVTADFNRDGKADLAVRNQSSNTVSVLLGNGDGSFRPAASFVVGTGTASSRVAVGDFNGDGELDLAATNHDDNTVSILIGNGDGTFKSQVVYPAGPEASAIAVADFNADGKLDLAIVNTGANNTVSILMGNGNGTFEPPVQYATGVGPAWITVADLNDDGFLDLVVPNTTASTVSVLLGKGDGTFQKHVDYAVSTGAARSEVADLNGDGKPDLAIAPASISDAVSILLGNGDGTFQAPVMYPTSASLPAQVVAGDFNGDGSMDLAIADNGASQVFVLLQIPSISLSPTSLNFAHQLIRTSSPSQRVTLYNGGPPLTVKSIAITGTDSAYFAQTNTCDSGLPPGGLCTIGVTLTPTKVGPRNASVTITDNAAGSPQSISLSGIGFVSGPNITLSPTSLTFATQLVSTTSPAQPITLTNFGTDTLRISGITIKGSDSGDFAQTNNCSGTSTVAPGANCTINVAFTPTQSGSRTATLSIADNAPGSPQTFSLGGTATVVELKPASLSFGVVQVGQSKTLATTLTNAGSGTLSITAITLTNAWFSQFNTCGSSVGAGQSCTISVTMRPTFVQTERGDLSISDNGGGSPQQVSLSGSGAVSVCRANGATCKYNYQCCSALCLLDRCENLR
jgi:hypothetical protein